MYLPNLELLVYKAQQILAHDEEFIAEVAEKKKSMRHAQPCFDVEVFPQVWGSTNTGFDISEDGEPLFGGSAMTEDFTTVVHERLTDCYCVFFGDRPCYKVAHANEDFYNDLRNHTLASLSEAKKRY